MAETPNYLANDPQQIIAELQRKLVERTAQRDEATSQQVATADILKVISQSAFDLQVVLDSLVESAAKLCDTDRAVLIQKQGDQYYRVALQGFPADAVAEMKGVPVDLKAGSIAARALRSCTAVHVADVNADAEYPGSLAQSRGGVRTVLSVPLIRETLPVGAITVSRTRVEPFTEKQIDLIRTFADQAVIAIENTRLFNETRQALERQTATADILKVIASSPSDAQPVFDAIASSAKRLIGGFSAGVYRYHDGVAYLTAFTPTDPAADEVLKNSFPRPIAATAFPLTGDGKPAQLVDTELAQEQVTREIARARGFRSLLLVPLVNDGFHIGIIAVSRTETGSFADHHVQLLQTFADQAVIAIENVRLFNETQEALERQTATADILRVIAGSPDDVKPVFEAIAQRSKRLVDALSTTVFTLIDGAMHLQAFTPTNREADVTLQAMFPADLSSFSWNEAIRNAQIFRITDTEREPSNMREIARLRGFRSMLLVPLVRQQRPIGLISVTRVEPGPFSNHHVQLLQTFADQAVIAIQNVKLFEEAKDRTRDLQESLRQQTATADVLKVISRSAFDLQPVFDVIAEDAVSLCEAERAFIFRYDGRVLRAVAHCNAGPEVRQFVYENPIALGRQSISARAALERRTIHVADVQTDPDYHYALRDVSPIRTLLAVPMLKGGELVGVIASYRLELKPFSTDQIALLETFADQAVIAIENARLFNETKEALEQQTATKEVLEVINSSPGNLAPVFDAMLEKAIRLCDAVSGHFRTYDGNSFPLAAMRGEAQQVQAMQKRGPLVPGPHHPVSHFLRGENIVHLPNAKESEPYRADDSFRSLVDRGALSMLSVALRKDGLLLGYINVYRHVAEPFTDRQIVLLQNFASQAVIAMENVRLITQTREALEQQTATADVLKVISRSAFDLGSVMNTLTHSAAGLCKAEISVLYLREGDVLVARGVADADPAQADFLRRTPLQNDRTTYVGRTILAGAIRNIADVANETEIGLLKKFSEALGFKSILFVPLMREGRGIGVFALARKRTGQFTQREVALVQTFADQAVIAVENVRLFDEVQARTRDLSEALTYQTGTSSILSVIASSPTDVTPVLQAIVKSACELCGAYDALVRLKVGDELQPSAHHGPIPASRKNWQINRNWTGGRAVIDRKPVHVHDVLSPEGDEFPETQEIARQQGYRTSLSVPLLREGESIGAIVLRRIEMHPFSDKQIALLQTFADQAVIAIGNVRMFEQVQQRTDELSQSLDELRTAQERLIQTEKLASLGQLTAGIAHEIKNPLNFVNNFSALSAELTDELNDVLKPVGLERKVREEVNELTGLLKDNLQKVVQHGNRADSIVKNMLLHSREGSRGHRLAEINSLLDESLNLAYHGARAENGDFNIMLQRDFDDSAGTIEVFPQEITRVFLNLISNGFYAATKRKTEGGEPGFEPIICATTKSRGDTVEIRIRDNGVGIPAEVKEKIFNPFFTTKPAGEGTGLGLSISHDIIVKQHGGSIDVKSVPGAFTEFTVILPRTSNQQSKQRGQS